MSNTIETTNNSGESYNDTQETIRSIGAQAINNIELRDGNNKGIKHEETKIERAGGLPAENTYYGDRLVATYFYQYEDEDGMPEGPIVDVWFDNAELYRIAAGLNSLLIDNADEDSNDAYGSLTSDDVDWAVDEIKKVAENDDYFDKEKSFNAIDYILSFDHNMTAHSLLSPIENALDKSSEKEISGN